MKLYVLDDSGHVVFEFSPDAGGLRLATSMEIKVKIISLVKAALKFLRQ
jgi:hypothetical protein